MKLIVLQEKLKNGLSTVERIPVKSLSLPILDNLLIEGKKNFLYLAVTDLEVGVNYWTLAKIEEEGKIVLPMRVFSGFVNYLPNRPVSLKGKDMELLVECENYKTQIKGINPEDFPIIPTINKKEFVSVDGPSFCQGLAQIVEIATPSQTKPEISGVFFSFQKDLIKMAATDSFRLGERTVFLEKPNEISQEYSLILPQKAAREIVNIFGDKPGPLKIYFSPNQILFEALMPETPHPQIQLISRLIEGEYPNYQEIIPKKSEARLVSSRNELLNQIKSASLFSGKINEVKFKIGPQKDKIELVSQSPDLGEYRSFLPGRIKGKEMEVSFNYRFLVDGLLKIKGSEVVFEFTDPGGPAVLKPLDDSSYIYVVMPIRAS